jgi:acyl carrier protein
VPGGRAARLVPTETGHSYMQREDLFRVLLESINEHGGRDYAPDDVDRSRPVFDYGVDSLNVMQILAEVEDALGLEIDIGSLSEGDLASIDSLLDWLASLRETAPKSM